MRKYEILKRLTTLLLGAALLLTLAPAAWGETLYTHGISTNRNDPGAAAFKDAHPQVNFVSDDKWYGSTEELIEGLSKQPKRDLFYADSLCQNLDAILTPAYCADLTGSATVRAIVERMHPVIQEQVMRDGKIYAIPTWVSFSSLSWCQDAWDAAGLTAEDVPTTYVELLDFLERWVERIKKEPLPEIHVENRFDETIYGKHTYTSWLLEILIKTYILQAKYAGEVPDFDAPAFRALVERSVAVGRALYQHEPLKKGQGRMPRMRLFTNNILSYTYLEMEDGFSHVIPLRITADQPALYEASLHIYCAGADGANPALALEFLDAAASHLEDIVQDLVFTDGEPLDGWLSEQWLAEYRACAGQLFFPKPWAMDHTWVGKCDQYGKGAMSTEEFITWLTEEARKAGTP